MKNDGYVKRCDIMPYLLNNLAYWGEDDVSSLLNRMPTISGFGVKILLMLNKI